MLLRRNWFPLLLTGFLTSSFLALYFVMVEKEASFSRIRFVEMLPNILSEENGKFNFHYIHLAKGFGIALRTAEN